MDIQTRKPGARVFAATATRPATLRVLAILAAALVPSCGPQCPSLSGTSFTMTSTITGRGTGCSGARDGSGTLAFSSATLTYTENGGSNSLRCSWSQDACAVSINCDSAASEIRWPLTLSTDGRFLTGTGYSANISGCSRIEYAITATR